MSAIGEAYLVPRNAFATVRSLDELRFQAREIVEYGWSGYVLATVLPYLERRGVVLDSGDELGTGLSETSGATVIVLRATEFDPGLYDRDELQAYYEEFNAVSADGVGAAMTDGIAFLARAAAAADAEHVAVVVIG